MLPVYLKAPAHKSTREDKEQCYVYLLTLCKEKDFAVEELSEKEQVVTKRVTRRKLPKNIAKYYIDLNCGDTETFENIFTRERSYRTKNK